MHERDLELNLLFLGYLLSKIPRVRAYFSLIVDLLSHLNENLCSIQPSLRSNHVRRPFCSLG